MSFLNAAVIFSREVLRVAAVAALWRRRARPTRPSASSPRHVHIGGVGGSCPFALSRTCVRYTVKRTRCTDVPLTGWTTE